MFSFEILLSNLRTEIGSCETQNCFQISFDTIDHNSLSNILSFFQKNEESLIVSLVCKKWNSIIKQSCKIDFELIAQHYASQGHLHILQWVKYD